MASIDFLADSSRTFFTYNDTYPLGHEVVTADSINDRYVWAQRLKLAATTLQGSSDPIDQDSLQRIETAFSETAPDDLDPQIDAAHIVQWFCNSNTSDLLRFCEWNIVRYEQQQSALSGAMVELQNDVQERVKRLINVSFFPRLAYRLAVESMEQIGDYYALDSFTAAGRRIHGHCAPGEPPIIAIANLFDNKQTFSGIGSRIKRISFHESLHGIGYATNRGFTDSAEGVETKTALGTWLEETFVSHAVQVSDATEPAPNIVIPEYRPSDLYNGSFWDLRKIAGVVMKYGPNDISIGLVCDAFFESLDTPGKPARRELKRRLNINLAALIETTDPNPIDSFTREWSSANKSRRADLEAQTARRLMRTIVAIDPDFTVEAPSSAACLNIVFT